MTRKIFLQDSPVKSIPMFDFWNSFFEIVCNVFAIEGSNRMQLIMHILIGSQEIKKQQHHNIIECERISIRMISYIIELTMLGKKL